MEHCNHLANHGYSFIPSDYYKSLPEINSVTEGRFTPDLESLRNNYIGLQLDPYSPGNRYRSYAQCRLDDAGNLEFGHFSEYKQTKLYNPDTGGIIREYPMIHQEVLRNPIFQALLKDDIAFVNKYKELGDTSDNVIGVHLFRYKATATAPAFSSPVWLHKDDEDVVFVHLIDYSSNVLGGESLIATDARHIERVIRLENVFDTVVVNHKKYHAVTPVGCRAVSEADFSTRDIILVTFQKAQNPA